MIETQIGPHYFGLAEKALFGWFHPAAGEFSRDTGIVICNPIGDDHIRAHRPIRHLAERLASAGFSVLRFDFHGTGDSSGDESQPDRLNTWIGDIEQAVENVRARGGVSKVVLVGLRLGGTLAAAAAARQGHEVDSLVLWNPFASGSAFVSESLKQHKMQAFLDPDGFSLQNPIPEKSAGEEALGFFLSTETIESLNGLALKNLQYQPALATLLVAPKNEALVAEQLSLLGSAVEHKELNHKFLIMVPHQSTLPEKELSAITEWLCARHKPVDKRSVVSPRPGTVLPHEETVTFGPENSLFGILTSPVSTKVDRPAIIIVNAGTVHRMGPHRFYVKMAREWARLGFHVFRMDLTGIGDSRVEAGTKENVCYPNRGLADVKMAMDLLEKKIGSKSFIMAGLCSGGDITFQTGYHDARVKASIIMNPRTFCVHDLEMVEMFDRAHYFQGSLMNLQSWKKLLSGEVDIARHLRDLIPNLSDLLRRKIQEILPTGKPVLEKAVNDVPTCLKKMADRGVDTFLVVSEHDPGIDYVDVHFGPKMKKLEGLKGFRRTNFKGTDHTFTSLYAQKLILNTVSDHLLRNHAQP